MKIFSGLSNKSLSEKIAKELGQKLSELDIFIFPDDERRVRVRESVLDLDTVVIESTNKPAEKNYMELFFIVDALKRSGAKTVTAVIPYLGYQRQDHVFRDGEAVSLEVIVRTLEAVGVDKIISFDMHTPRIPELFKIPVIHLSAFSLFAEKIKKIDGKNGILISPDMGGIRRIKILSEFLGGMEYGSIEKNRDLATGHVEAEKITGDVKGKNVYLVDDMISTGGTILTACNLLREKGAKNVYVFATHAVFCKEAPQILKRSRAEKIFVTDTIGIPERNKFENLEILSVAGIVAETLRSK
ncbi:ribose-phosphate pyrophosphokinase [Patescibacteria group bacterium]|nr:ribose-phosphate pyrophosphokinase [Patescibacteria group bacterium]